MPARYFLKVLSLLLLFSSFTTVSLSQKAFSQSSTSGEETTSESDGSCDPDFMRAVSAYAYTQMNAEISTNSSFITKPPSVLQLVCFSKFVDHLAKTAKEQPLFSEEAQPFGVKTPSGMEGALASLVTGARASSSGTNSQTSTSTGSSGKDTFINQYINSGESSKSGTSTSGSSTGTGTSGSSTNSSTNACGAMDQAWTDSKCTTSGTAYSAGFAEADWYNYANKTSTTQDPSCTSGSAAAQNESGHSNIERTVVKTYLDKILWKGHELAKECANPPIETGVTVRRKGMDPYPDAVCPNPGCSYNGDARKPRCE